MYSKQIIPIFWSFVLVLSCSIDTLYLDNSINKGMDQIQPYSDRVSVEDVLQKVSEEFGTKASDDYGIEIDAYTDRRGDTLMYVVKYSQGGWKVFSADKRTPPVLAEDSKGCFNVNDNPNINSWVKGMEEDMRRIIASRDNELAFSEDDIALNRSYWSGIPYTKIYQTRSGGYWEVRITSFQQELESKDHMVAQWAQGEPYNEYCPLKSSGTGRAPAGCVAVAGAQVLAFLHDTLGVPSVLYSEAVCSGDVNGFSRSFSNETADAWDDLAWIYTYPPYAQLQEAVLIGYVGALAGTHYHNDYSWTLPSNLRTSVFSPYGIACSHGSYDADITASCLMNGMPVIVTASNLLIPTDFNIHCFVIDGYKIVRTVYVHHHYWVPEENPSSGSSGHGPDPSIGSIEFEYEPEPFDTFVFSDPWVKEVKINWGWSSQWMNSTNDGWYALTGGWSVGNYDYNHNRVMIYGFELQ